jgi:hypothetical protein
MGRKITPHRRQQVMPVTGISENIGGKSLPAL